MKLLLVTYGLNTVGGVQHWQHLFVHQILGKGHDVTILEMYDYSEMMPDMKVIRKWSDKIRIIKLNGPIIQRGINPFTIFSAVYVALNFWKKMKLEKFISKERFDAILFPDPNFTFSFFGRTLKKNHCIVQFHSSFDRFRSTSKLRYLLTKWRIRSINKFVLLSKGDVSRALECGFDEQRMSFVYNFIDELQFSPYNNRSFVSLKQILVVGNLDNPDKQIDHVLKAFRLVNKEQRKDWKVKIIGDGRTKNSLINLSHELGISDYVQFSGKKADPIIDFFESDFYVLSSSFEGFPLTLLECVFSNLPIVSYPCAPSINEIVVNDVNGIVVKPNDIHSLSRAIQYLISNPDILAVMSQNQTSFKHKFNTNNILEKWEGLLFNKTTPIN